MSDLITGAALGAAGGLAGGIMSHHSAKSAQKRSFRQTKRIMQNQIQWKAQDLENAGFNKILAAGVAGGGSPSMSPAQTPDFAGAISSGIGAGTAATTAKEQRNLLREQQEQAKSNSFLNYALSTKAMGEARLASANADQAEVMKGLYKAVGPSAESFFNGLGELLNQWVVPSAKNVLPSPSGSSVPSGSAYQKNVITPIVDIFQRLLDPNYSAYSDFVITKPKSKPKSKPKHEPIWEFK